MFLHSGASLHGHEFSKRATQTAAGSGNLRKPLLRSTFSSAASKPFTHQFGPPASSAGTSGVKKSTTFSEPSTRQLDSDRVDFKESKSDTLTSDSEESSEDETSTITSDTDVSRVPSPVRQRRRPRTRKSTTYVLAHPPPKPRTKQRIIHTRPNLVLQIQKVTSGSRPRPVIDVYPSSSVSRSTMAPLLKRFPPISGIRRELSIHDIMLLRSEDYASQSSVSESDYDEDDMMGREVLAVVCPAKTEDKAEIVMADGTVWMATTRSSGNTYAYEFTSDGPPGTAVTARWVRKHNMSISLPVTPTSHGPNSMDQLSSDSKFTFSFINPNYRRHPILATLTSTSLSIAESYTAISHSTVQPSSLPQKPSAPESPINGNQLQEGGHIRPVEEWQKAFIEISAVWVALRNGWASNFRPSIYTSVTSQVEGYLCRRQRSLSANSEFSSTPMYWEATGLRKRQRNARALSGDWNVGLSKSVRDNSQSMLGNVYVATKTDARSHRASALASPSGPTRRRAVSFYSPVGTLSFDTNGSDELKPNAAFVDVAQNFAEPGDVNELGSKCRRRKLKNMANWFRKLSER